MTEELQNQIERYLFHEMTEEEERDFTARINNDADLKEEVELIAMIIAATTKAGREKDASEIEMLKQTSLDDIRKLAKRPKSKTVLKTAYWFTASAAVILLAFIINHFYKVNSEGEQLFAAYYTPYHDDTGLHRGGSIMTDEDTALLTEAMELYTTGQYAEALDAFNKISSNYSDEVAIYKAVCMLEIGSTDQSIQLLSESMEKHGEGWEHYQDSQWYLALSYLKDKRNNDAQSILEQIVTDGRFYAEKADEILKRLNNSR
jgi:tetratricopeptide (TPR) repeat protein